MFTKGKKMRYSKAEKEAFMKLTLPDKVKRTKMLLMEWLATYPDSACVSFSGGKDSTVLLHLVRSLKEGENTPAVFDDTGLEFPEIREFVKKQKGVKIIRPKKSFKQVIEEFGYPIISKRQSQVIYDIRHTKNEQVRQNYLYNNKIFKLSKKWRPLLNSDFEISNKCCYWLKKSPMNSLHKKPIIAMLAEEGSLRMRKYLEGDCNSKKYSNPMMFWTEQDVLQYIYENKIEIASIYGEVVKDENGKFRTTGATRTGCMFCMYGLHFEPDRFEKQLKPKHPELYDYIMNKLGFKHVREEYFKCAFPEKYKNPDLFERKENEIKD